MVVVKGYVNTEVAGCSATSGWSIREKVVSGNIEAPEADFAVALEPFRVRERKSGGSREALLR